VTAGVTYITPELERAGGIDLANLSNCLFDEVAQTLDIDDGLASSLDNAREESN
jgi:hypothetical protein